MQLVGPEDDGDDDVAVMRAAFRRRLEETRGVIMTSSADVTIEGGDALVADRGDRGARRRRSRTSSKRPSRWSAVASGPILLSEICTTTVFDDPKRGRCAVRARSRPGCSTGRCSRGASHPTSSSAGTRSGARTTPRSAARILKGERFLDSPKLCADAARRYHGEIPPVPGLPEWRSEHWKEWCEVRDTVHPQKAAARLHDYLVRDAIAWAREHTGIIWYSTVELAEWIHELSGIPVYGGGPDAEAQIERLIRSPRAGSVLASMNSPWSGARRLAGQVRRAARAQRPVIRPSQPATLRALHRRGQKADTVRSYIYVHTDELREAHEQAIRRSDYAETLFKQRQKLTMGLPNVERPLEGISPAGARIRRL